MKITSIEDNVSFSPDKQMKIGTGDVKAAPTVPRPSVAPPPQAPPKSGTQPQEQDGKESQNGRQKQ
jgi:hypothetical protein